MPHSFLLCSHNRKVTTMASIGEHTEHQILGEYGVIHIKGALTKSEQIKLFDKVRGKSKVPSRSLGESEFHLSSGEDKFCDTNLMKLGETLYNLCADVLEEVDHDDARGEKGVKGEPALARLGRIKSSREPVDIITISGKNFLSHANLNNHTDYPGSLYTMSLALGDSIDFTIGKATIKPHKKERSGTPVTIRMNSGDCIFFDGGCVPHAVDKVIKGSAPSWWDRAARDVVKADRMVILFREAPIR